ncbi:MAG: methionine adenosyltransferase [Candidatus Eisenbacteria bacterium]|uniref:S-adenosylmethionine synthase n=1 Tax=Eiseniibacteriota bacterium TaxID=2212470 RepID=A0A9D6L7M3_UNCEI|nr:methionine adenosyltransferase [Candidatus Eisenbacteria bacterium]MBI3539344.1 methionine adenosyltransferase [Candidatus Eisenbacteria bacterium]
MADRHLFTSESVTEGHPDKIADQISDAVLDALIAQDPKSRVACEVLVTTGLAVVAGEISSRGYVEIPSLVRRVIGDIGYDSAEYGFDSHTCAVVTTIDDQSPDIAMGVDKGGAGDQGLMFGFACRETRELMPLPITLAHALTRRLAHARRSGLVPYLRPDGKSQVTVEYERWRPVRVDTVVVSSQHAADISHKTITRDIIEHVVKPVIPRRLIDRTQPIKVYVNPTGSFVKGGPMADTGLTGRKIIVDTYGGVGSHGGGALSGKDPSKVDRSASYGARYVAKNLVASGLCDRAEVQIAYAIGIPKPVSIMVDSKGTGRVSDAKLTDLVRKHFDLTPHGLIKHLRLRRPIFRATAAYGHFGRTGPGFTWEKTDKARALARSV